MHLIATAAFLLFSFTATAQTQDPPQFDLGEDDKTWGLSILPENQSKDFSLRVGTRLQGLAENTTDNSPDQTQQDFYVRRARLQVEAKFLEDLSFYMDIRADEVDKDSDEENSFALGDAYFQIKNLFGNESLKLRAFRAKYDISRTQTVSSANLLILHRTAISDYASNYISNGRRGSNLQILGNWSDRIETQIVVGDSVHQSSFVDALKNKAMTVDSQVFAYGARLRVSPFKGWESKKLTETYFGKGKHFSLGAAFFQVPSVEFTTPTGNFKIDRDLANFELSFHLGPFSLAAEYFVFDGMVANFSDVILDIGKSKGWFVQSEWVFPQWHYISLFGRYQQWDRFEDRLNFGEESKMIGINYYLKGNKLRTGVYFEDTNYEQALAAAAGLPLGKQTTGLYLMMHY